MNLNLSSYRMKHILNEINPHICLTKKYAISHNRIIDAVDFHRRAIELVNYKLLIIKY